MRGVFTRAGASELPPLEEASVRVVAPESRAPPGGFNGLTGFHDELHTLRWLGRGGRGGNGRYHPGNKKAASGLK